MPASCPLLRSIVPNRAAHFEASDVCAVAQSVAAPPLRHPSLNDHTPFSKARARPLSRGVRPSAGDRALSSPPLPTAHRDGAVAGRGGRFRNRRRVAFAGSFVGPPRS
jgi:hypothetical protein